MANTEDYLKLRQTPLHELSPVEQIAFCSATADWLSHPDPWIRDDAAERLATAVFWERYENGDPNAPAAPHSVERATWLLATIDAANSVYPDVVPSFIRHLRYRYPSGDQAPIVLAWLGRLERQPPPGLDVYLATGVRMLHASPDDWSTAAPRWLALLDHPSDWLRGCAAIMLANCSEDDSTPSTAELFTIIGDKEVARPGVAGPFWSPFHIDGSWEDGSWTVPPALWMLDLLERRNGPPPSFGAMPSNDIEFFLHELCSFSPDLVDRMIRGNFIELALMTATEIHGFVEGMRPRLETLAGNADASIAAAASQHLKLYYAANQQAAVTSTAP